MSNSQRIGVVWIDGDDGCPTCPHDPNFEHRRSFPYLGACVPKNLSDRTGMAKGYPQRWDPTFPNPVTGTPGQAVFDGGCDKRTRDGLIATATKVDG